MRLVIEITSECGLGKKMWLRAGQIAEVGRSEYVDFTLTHDRLMSDVHFTLACNRQECRLRDLNSNSGTSVNGSQVTECTLRDQDTIVAGQTHFSIRLEGANQPAVDDRASSPEATETMTANSSHDHSATIGLWTCKVIPPQWELIPNQGFRWTGEGSFPTSLVLLQSDLPGETTLEEFVGPLVKQLAGSFSEPEVEGPTPVRVAGADEAVEFVVRHSKSDANSVCQRYLYARQDRTMGIATLTTSAMELQSLESSVGQIFDGMSLAPLNTSP